MDATAAVDAVTDWFISLGNFRLSDILTDEAWAQRPVSEIYSQGYEGYADSNGISWSYREHMNPPGLSEVQKALDTLWKWDYNRFVPADRTPFHGWNWGPDLGIGITGGVEKLYLMVEFGSAISEGGYITLIFDDLKALKLFNVSECTVEVRVNAQVEVTVNVDARGP